MAAQEIHAEHLLGRSNVVGVGTGFKIKGEEVTDVVCVQILVSRKLPPEELAARDLVPPKLEAPDRRKVVTDVIEVPPFDAYQDRTRYRPVPAGCSIGPEASVSAGTLGGWACDNTDDTTVLLTNNHVISNLDTMPVLRRIVQPGRFDGGVLPGDVIGRLKRHIPLATVANVPGANPPASVVDAAIGTIDVDWTSNLLQINVPVIFELQAPALGMNVQKRGRTTRRTTNGRITTINLTTLVTYRNRTRLGRIQNAFVISSTDGNPFSAAGDSGSLILNQAAGELNGTFPVVGLLFAGGRDAAGNPLTVANDINAVFGALDLETVCVCVARAIIRAIFGAELVEERDIGRFLHFKERQLRRLRWRLTRRGRFGEAVEREIRTEAARVGAILAEDDEAFGLLVKTLRPMVRQATVYDILRMKLDREFLENLNRFSSRIARRSRGLRPKVGLAKALLKQLEGLTVGDVIRSAELTFEVKRPPRRRRR
jgi:hypothetical protein